MLRSASVKVVSERKRVLSHFRRAEFGIISRDLLQELRCAPGSKDVALCPGAAPITLIDGARLLELLIHQEIGIQKKPVYIFELDEVYLQPEDTESGGDEVTHGPAGTPTTAVSL